MPPTPSPQDPARVGEYWLAGRLGAGGQGVVYEAYDRDGGRVAVKLLHASVAADPEILRRFAREAVAAQRVASFCTARVLAAEVSGPRPYLVSEYVEGPSLRAAVERGRRFGGDDLVRLATAIATALTAIHEAGVVHRDLKPDNVLLGPDGPRVIDFGIARTEDMSLTSTGLVAGTPLYMAPEIFTGERATPAADVFAWGAVLLYAATGEDPFAAGSLGAIMHRVLSADLDLTPLPPALRPLAAAALARTPGARPSARDLLLSLVTPRPRDQADPVRLPPGAPAVRHEPARDLRNGDALGRDAPDGDLLARGREAAGGLAREGDPDPDLGARAEEVYARLDGPGRDAAPGVLLRLVTLDDAGFESPRPALREDLAATGPGAERVVGAFGEAGLLRGEEEYVLLTRPALVRAWPRLRGWLDEDRGGLRLHAALAAGARAWRERGRKDADLLHGGRLDDALAWAATGRRHLTLNPGEREFLDASAALTRRRRRRRALLTLALAVLLVLSLAGGGLAAYQSSRVAEQRDLAAGRELAHVAGTLRATDPVRAMLLNVAAWTLAPGPDTRSGLMAALYQPEAAAFQAPRAAGPVRRVLSGDGRRLVSVSADGVSVHDVATGRRAGGWADARVKDADLQDVSLSRDGRRLAIVADRTVRVWDTRTGRPLREHRLAPQAPQVGADFGGGDRLLALTEGQGLLLWDTATGGTRGRGLDWQSGRTAIHGDLVAVAGLEARLAVYRSGAPDPRFRGACPGEVRAVAISPDGRTLACGGARIRLIDTATGRPLPASGGTGSGETGSGETGSGEARAEWPWRISGGERLNLQNTPELRFSADGRLLAGFGDRNVKVWRVADRRLLLDYTAPGLLADARPDPGGRFVRVLMDDTVLTLDLAAHPASRPLPEGAEATAFAPGGGLLALQAADLTGAVRLWDVRRGAEVELPGAVSSESALRPAFDRAGRVFAAADARHVSVWDTRGPRSLRRFPVPPGSRAQSVALSPDGRRLAVVLGSEGDRPEAVLRLWDLSTGRATKLPVTAEHGGVVFTPDGGALASTGGGRARLLDLATGRPSGPGYGGESQDHVELAFSAQGLMAVADSSGRIALWDRRGPEPLPPAMHGVAEAIEQVAFSPGGDLLATGGDSGTVQLWDVRTRRLLGTPWHHGTGIGALAFTPDGSALLAAADPGLSGEPGRVITHPVAPGEVVRLLCARAGRTLTDAEWSRHLAGTPRPALCPAP
ncbi:serine/threonine-protein kinase [Bailinhaonella thermotolerans]|uniref:Protein kinase domain-containing protein n=1 Tax=Bailinhaonella thermotolerans TaxID=1070861 RepID=A0A3A4AZJ9_9ACTN|nr:serine/threonine-protein kinase [Bailinhaonella thermotolerans]RJL24802.1 hypothetical protein D5H75_28900 [Bailinhaonella thermotolerans]